MPRKTEKQVAEANTYKKRFCHGGVGRALENDKKKQAQDAKNNKTAMEINGVAQSQAAKSVLEQTSLDDFMSTANLGRTTFDGVRGNHLVAVDYSAHLVSSGPGALSTADKERAAAARRVQVPIPRRPQWDEVMSGDQLTALEAEAFVTWRRGLALIEEGEGLVMTPYERNLDFWRQLWRCVERSELVVQILDARDPEFYRSHDLERYVGELGSKKTPKKTLLLINKADFLSPEIRRTWSAHFAAAGVDHLFFSALRELHRQSKTTAGDSEETGDAAGPTLPPHGPLMGDDAGELIDCIQLMEELRARLTKPDESNSTQAEKEDANVKRGVIGFVGYPNVGKSSVINALFGAKKVSVSRTPGKTKHLQTLELPEFGVTLCDCPGLVFPSVVASKAHLVINGTVPITELREANPPAKLVVEKVGLGRLMEKYGIPAGALAEASERLGEDGAIEETDKPRAFLAALAMTRGHFIRYAVPDEGWGARKILREYVTGEVLHCERPVGFAPPPRVKEDAVKEDAVKEDATSPAPDAEASSATPDQVSSSVAEGPAKPGFNAEESDSDFSDLEDFLNESRGAKKPNETKRKARQQDKRAQKGGPMLAKAAP